MMNMCKIIDNKNNKILVQQRVKSWKGIAFPGGKINNGESIVKSTIREVKEETGLDIVNLKLCGIKNWYDIEKNERFLIFLYQTNDFSGQLIEETAEGKNYWVYESEINQENLADNFDVILKIYSDNNLSEMIYSEQNKEWELF